MKQSNSQFAILLTSLTAFTFPLTYPAAATPPSQAQLTAIGQAKTTISAVPYTISTPGTYLLTGDLVLPQPASVAAITIYAPGKVILNLNGFTITGGEIEVLSNDVTIHNGTIINGGISAVSLPPGAHYPTAFLTGLILRNLSFLNPAAESTFAISFFMVNGATVSDCSFTGSGVYDYYTSTGNRFSRLSFAASTPYTGINVETPYSDLFLSKASFSPLTAAAAGAKP